MDFTSMNKADLQELADKYAQEYAGYKAMGLKLNMARGKPAPKQLDLSNGLFTALAADDYLDAAGNDVRNYGVLDGIQEAKELFAPIFGMEAENVVIGGSASLNLMFDTVARAFVNGVLPGATPWGKLAQVKFLCPAPGYDRHFTICEHFGIEMITVPLLSDGPDLDELERLLASDESIKGIWCVPMYSNPTGITYSDAVVKRLAALKPAAADFRIFWDNAYGVHHLDKNDHDQLLNIYPELVKQGNQDLIYMFASTSKITLAGAGISAMAASPANIAQTKKLLNSQTISFDKVNQLRHVRFFGDIQGLYAHMEKHAGILKPKFQVVLKALQENLAEYNCAQWENPKGGYFVSVNTLEGCAKRVVELCKEAGMVLTGAGATFPYGKDPLNRNIRIAPSYPTVEELEKAMELFCLCVKIASVEKLLA